MRSTAGPRRDLGVASKGLEDGGNNSSCFPIEPSAKGMRCDALPGTGSQPAPSPKDARLVTHPRGTGPRGLSQAEHRNFFTLNP